jgi:hypothetical protein
MPHQLAVQALTPVAATLRHDEVKQGVADLLKGGDQ